MSQIKVVVIAGPTGVGKTSIASMLARVLGGEIISCDSVQVYKDLNIGSNKEVNLDIQQHLIDIVHYKENFSAGDYHDLCLDKIKEINSRNKIPFIVGGTGFYMKWLLHGKPGAPPSSPLIMEEVRRLLKGKTWEESLAVLSQWDPDYASKLASNDVYRLERALSICVMTGKPLSNFIPSKDSEPIHPDNSGIDFRCFYLTNDRMKLARLIDLRCEEMLNKGLIEEVIHLQKQGLNENDTGGRAIGYYQTLMLIKDLKEYYKLHREEARKQDDIDKIICQFITDFQTASRQYSKRQDTWFQDEKEFEWVHWGLFKDDSQLLSEYIASMIDLSREAWVSNQALKSTTEASKKLRFNETFKQDMRTYRQRVEIYNTVASRQTISKTIEAHLLSIDHNLFNSLN